MQPTNEKKLTLEWADIICIQEADEKTKKLRSDVLTYLAKQPYIISRSHLIPTLRIFALSLKPEEVNKSLICGPMTEQVFTARNDTIIDSYWNFGSDIEVLFLSNPITWTKAQEQEFDLRVNGYVPWAGVMNEAGWLAKLSGYKWNYTWGQDTSAIPLIVIDPTESYVDKCVPKTSILSKWGPGKDTTELLANICVKLIRGARQKDMLESEVFNERRIPFLTASVSELCAS